jgi:hypothetical protein
MPTFALSKPAYTTEICCDATYGISDNKSRDVFDADSDYTGMLASTAVK